MADKGGAAIQEAPDDADLEAGSDLFGGPGEPGESADGVVVDPARGKSPSDAARLANEQARDRSIGGAADDARTPQGGEPSTPDTSNLIFGKYRTQEEAEQGYRELERARGADSEKASRLEKLLEGALTTAIAGKPGTPGAGGRGAAERPSFDMVNWIARASLGEPDVKPDEFIDALAEAMLSHPRINEGMARRIHAEREITAEQETLRTTFFDSHKHLANAPEWFLKNVALQVEADYNNDPAVRNLPRGEIASRLIEETGKRATEMLRKMGARFDGEVGSERTPEPPPGGNGRRAPSGVFGERGGLRPGGKVKLTGQDAELASVFGE